MNKLIAQISQATIPYQIHHQLRAFVKIMLFIYAPFRTNPTTRLPFYGTSPITFYISHFNQC